MSGTKISPLEAIYIKEAVRQHIAPHSLWRAPWKSDVGNYLDKARDWILQRLRPDETGFLTFPAALMSSHFRIPSVKMLFGEAQVDPFRMDALDCLIILVSNDEDFTRDKNKRGPNRKWSAEARRLLSQFQSCGHVNPADLATMMKIGVAHLEQTAGHVAGSRKADPKGILAILRQRIEQAEFLESDRLKAATDPRFDFLRATYVWSTTNTIRVHARGKGRQDAFVEYFHRIKDLPEYQPFYRSTGLVDQRAARVINGKPEEYQALRFPSDPVVAANLIAIIEGERDELGISGVICVSTRRLAAHVPGTPLLLGEEDPGLIPMQDHELRPDPSAVDPHDTDNDRDDDPGFKR